MRTVAFCEIDPYCRAVLAKHWPGVICFPDVCDLHAYDVGPVDVICGGFPCQDISTAGKGAGLSGARSGLWSEYRRLIEECRPAWVVIENVSALRSRGLDQVLGEISALGYDAEWHCIPASAVGAPHRRDRVWIVAHPQQHGEGRRGIQRPGENQSTLEGWTSDQLVRAGKDVADAYHPRLQGRLREILRERAGERATWEGGAPVGHAECTSSNIHPAPANQASGRKISIGEPGWWLSEPDVGRVADGVPSRVDRLGALGNAVVPQIPEIIGRAILEAEMNFAQR